MNKDLAALQGMFHSRMTVDFLALLHYEDAIAYTKTTEVREYYKPEKVVEMLRAIHARVPRSPFGTLGKIEKYIVGRESSPVIYVGVDIFFGMPKGYDLNALARDFHKIGQAAQADELQRLESAPFYLSGFVYRFWWD